MSRKAAQIIVYGGFGFLLICFIAIGMSGKKNQKTQAQMLNEAIAASIPDSIKERKTEWYYDNEEDKMTSKVTYTARMVAEEEITTGGHWEERGSTTTTTKTVITEKRPWYQSKSSFDRKKFNATTSTTTTNTTKPVFIANSGHMAVKLLFDPKKKTTVAFYSTTGTLLVNYSTIRIRFDKDEPMQFKVTPYYTSEGITQGFILSSPKEFIPRVKKANTMLLEFGADKSIFTYKVAGLEWEH
jgi:hypothetical protein